MSEAHFDVETIMDRSTKQRGTVSINRDNGLVTVRPLHSRRAYVVPLNDVVTMVVQKAIRQEVAENRRPRKKLANRGLLGLGKRGF